MALYSALQPHIEANQWFKNGDHPDDHTIHRINTGRVVKRHPYYKTPRGESKCNFCELPLNDHGIIGTAVTVCPGDYVVTNRDDKGRKLSYTLLKQELFEYMYGPYKEPKE
ncbi:hypothetical protein ST201phi2-1p001 [Pseudomonas phage 201phi2-1]|uniref:Uncharacterized protein n=1 Tax=Pseudomonas phage 201phi2-1 TaxID=198110 RepID=B3FJX7_BP201|nr:hypothetical protein ST201phi2-1p001 [Pseudomonas phage 201phi2-1]ABY62836.1 hypothetical protein 201phi2-1p001 [Pseudomonas phage 201phi2-1]